MIKENCPICGSVAIDSGSRGRADIYDYDCPRCGQFSITRTATKNLKSRINDKTSAIFSHAVRKMQKENYFPELDSKTVEAILENNRLPSPIEQANNLILWIGDTIQAPGEYIDLNPEFHRSVIGSLNNDNYMFIVNHLKDKGILKSNNAINRVTLTFDGWNSFDLLQRRSSNGRKAFMAMPFGKEIIDNVFKVFKKVVKQTGFDLVKLDEKPRAGSIDDRLRVEIRTSMFLIAELTDGNHGAYWEAGFAEGLGKPVIYTCERSFFKSKGTHFDTNHLHTVIWEIDKLEEAAELLKITIRATLPDEAKLED
ncbi:hypothetical protein [Geomesophilobacter sediminis]|uniref:Uncharacterized protein n=1 Tax=Geomesophilobacter sediminis TaxID=2798584 RepID=A0A8J7SDW7_9BACT|nr:hypothetical protein [Geomesophilobacter sediminis]MBJ6728024.1 hypothetical protein [Geomesophilobacter sediminis]